MKFLLIIFSCFIASSCYSKKIEVDIFKKDEINIKNFGFSYCLTKTKDKVLLSESSLAMGGYFQEGTYEEPAYKNIKIFVDRYISKNNDVYQSTGNTAILMNCLSMYNSTEYNKLLAEQNGYWIK
ncbi:hypothetical protein MF4642_10060 [Acinetobacter sp. MF4642]|jgi:hypothetical protein|uniref:hypothetical protein n=1 Tax=Acinetobacter sp. MF4642 TaxID=1960825 RepID=UPI0009CD2B52|nr:hypothetical protein [Acinetobacter sp. MF4642]OOW09448.1 hypothetical protein MF4642_10060 [Acinetobacter sp. MF4642]